MVSAIDSSKPIDGIDANKADLRANFAAAKSEIEALQTGGGGGGGIDTIGTIAAGSYPRFVDANTVEGLSAAALVATIDVLLPGAVANYRGVGDEAMSAAFAAVAGGGGGGTGLTPVDDSASGPSAVTIGAATTGTQRSMLSDSAITATLAANCPAGTVVKLIKSGNGLITVACQGAQAAGNGAGYYPKGDDQSGTTKATASFTCRGEVELFCRSNVGGDSALFVVDGVGLSLPSVIGGPVDFTAAGITVPNGAAVSGTLTKAVHGGGVYKTAGNVTITPAAGFTVTLLLGGAHTIGAGGTAHTPASGDAVSVVCFSATNGDVKLFKTTAANVVNLPTA